MRVGSFLLLVHFNIPDKLRKVSETCYVVNRCATVVCDPLKHTTNY